LVLVWQGWDVLVGELLVKPLLAGVWRELTRQYVAESLISEVDMVWREGGTARCLPCSGVA
jgi:hypothetical protein